MASDDGNQEKPKNEKATDAELGSEEKNDDSGQSEDTPFSDDTPPHDDDNDSEFATDVVEEHDQGVDQSKALMISVIFLVAIVVIVVLILLALRLLGGIDGEVCPGTELADRVGPSGGGVNCDREIEVG